MPPFVSFSNARPSPLSPLLRKLRLRLRHRPPPRSRLMRSHSTAKSAALEIFLGRGGRGYDAQGHLSLSQPSTLQSSPRLLVLLIEFMDSLSSACTSR